MLSMPTQNVPCRPIPRESVADQWLIVALEAMRRAMSDAHARRCTSRTNITQHRERQAGPCRPQRSVLGGEQPVEHDQDCTSRPSADRLLRPLRGR